MQQREEIKAEDINIAGSNDIHEVVWYFYNSSDKVHSVGSKKSNELGIYDMSGNALEWCWDWYGDYSVSAQTDPRGASSGSKRMCRGGNYGYFAAGCRPAYRDYGNPGDSGYVLGFRLVRSSK